MTKKKLNREPKDAAAPAIEMVRHLVEQMRQQGQSDAEILAALDRLERDNPIRLSGNGLNAYDDTARIASRRWIDEKY